MRELAARWDAVIDLGAAVPVARYALRGAIGMSAVATARVDVGPLATMTLSAFF